MRDFGRLSFMVAYNTTLIGCLAQHTLKFKLVSDILGIKLSTVILNTSNGVTCLLIYTFESLDTYPCRDSNYAGFVCVSSENIEVDCTTDACSKVLLPISKIGLLHSSIMRALRYSPHPFDTWACHTSWIMTNCFNPTKNKDK